MGQVAGDIPNVVTKAKKSTGEFIGKLETVTQQLVDGKGTFTSQELAEVDPSNPKDRRKILQKVEFFRDPSIRSLTTVIKTLNGFELCNPLTFAITQAFPPGSETSEKFNIFQGKVRDIFETFRNFSLVPGVSEITGVTVAGNPINLDQGQKVEFNLPPLNKNNPYPISNDTSMLFRVSDPKIKSQIRGRVINYDRTNPNVVTVQLENRNTADSPTDDSGQKLTFSEFEVEYTKKQNEDIIALSEELTLVAGELRELGYQDILNDLDGIPSSFPGVGKIKDTFVKIGRFIDQIGTPAAQVADELDDASQFLAGGLTSRQILEGSRLFQDFFRKIEPIVNFQNTLVTGYKDGVENLDNILRNAIPYDELSKFVTFVVDFARIINGVISMLIALLKVINTIIKTINTILKVFKVVIKVIKAVIKAIPSLFTTVGIQEALINTLSKIEGALDLAINFLDVISGFIDGIIAQLNFVKAAINTLIDQGAQLAAKLGSCNALKGNGMENGMADMVNQLRGTLRGLTGAAPGEPFYENPNAPGGGIPGTQLPPGIGTFVTLPNGDIMFLNDSIIGFDENGNLIFYANLTSLATGVAFNNTLGQSFRNRNLQYYTFDKFRASQAGLLEEADRIAFERGNRIEEVRADDRFGNFQEDFLGYAIRIQEEKENNPNAQKATRRRGIAQDSNEKIVASTELTFSQDLGGIVNEVKFLLKRDINSGLIGVNTTDPSPNDISDDDALNLVKSTNANPIAISNIEAEKSNKAAATLPQRKPSTNPETNQTLPAQQKSQGTSRRKSVDVGGIAQTGINEYVNQTPSLSNLAGNLNTINTATPSQLSNILNQPGAENLTEDELLEKLKGEIVNSIDPNPEKIDEVREKTQQWYGGIRSKARADFDQLKLAASIPKGGGPVFNASDAYEFEPYVSKIEEKEIPKWIKLLQRSGYTEAEITGGLSNVGIKDKYEIKFDDKGKLSVKKKLAFKEGNF